jgi:hypothetical protein
MKGGDFLPVQNFFISVKENIDELLELISQEPESSTNIVKVLGCGLESQDVEIFDNALISIVKIGESDGKREHEPIL